MKKPPVEESFETGPRWKEPDTQKNIKEFENVAEYIYGSPPVYAASLYIQGDGEGDLSEWRVTSPQQWTRTRKRPKKITSSKKGTSDQGGGYVRELICSV